jgi:hypothetical protein
MDPEDTPRFPDPRLPVSSTYLHVDSDGCEKATPFLRIVKNLAAKKYVLTSRFEDTLIATWHCKEGYHEHSRQDACQAGVGTLLRFSADGEPLSLQKGC